MFPNKKITIEILSVISSIITILGVGKAFNISLWVQFIIITIAIVFFIIFNWSYFFTPKIVPLRKVRGFDKKYDHLIFVYGSLLVRDNLLRTIPQRSSTIDCIPCFLRSYKLEWGAFSKRNELLDKDCKSIQDNSTWASLTAVQGSLNDKVPGAIIGVTNIDYVALKNREYHYLLKDITQFIEKLDDDTKLPNGRIMVFLPKIIQNEQNNSEIYIRKQYFDTISIALKKLGFNRLSKPKYFKLKSAFLINELVEKLFLTKYSEKALLDIYKEVSNDLQVSNETRSIQYSLRPLVLPRLVYNQASIAAETIVSISIKALKLLSYNPSLVLSAGYKEEDVISLSNSIKYGNLTPKIARVDMTLVGNRLQLFELNSDSPGGMRHIDMLSAKQSRVLKKYKKFYWIDGKLFETCEAIVHALENCCSTDSLKNAVILEYRPEDWPTYPEMLFFKESLNDRGIKTELIDLATNSLECRDNGLFLSNRHIPIDLVYKRILWNDLLKSHTGSEQALTESFNKNYTCIVNSLGARMAGNKMLLAMIKAPEFIHWLGNIGEKLTDEELNTIENFIPKTYIWGDTPDSLNWKQNIYIRTDIIGEPYRFVLKSYNGYGGHEVVIGCEKERPQAVFEGLWNKGYIAQEYVPHGRALMPIYYDGKISFEYHYYILGAYIIDGKCAAIEAKTSRNLPISMNNNAFRTSVFPTL